MRPFTRRFLRLVGVGLVLCGTGWVFTWFYFVFPLARSLDSRWLSDASLREYWDATQTRIHRTGWLHDDSHTVGCFGDKQWAEWIINRARHGEDISGCGNIGHKDHALRYLTNQDPTDGTYTNVSQRWIEWWTRHRDESQEQWIEEGFAAYGVKVGLPPQSEDIVPLLRLVRRPGTNEVHQLPHYISYNAYRWLRDSRFDPLGYALSNQTVHADLELRTALLTYAKWDRVYAQREPVGTLAFAPSYPRDSDAPLTMVFRQPWITIVYLVMVLPTLLGVFLIVRLRPARWASLRDRQPE